ncbi:O-antigen ligase family protein [Magnetospira sp. QH-2]|uniref:O-antigen ligase family protein n=1 Tax=Magnetospira sp. (strain QH-2) TaxID=1288970 RepID=UPI0003E81BF7|nr:O-antigen ligase family protein [Magnetospira sp. QH-2]CCQ75466.1 putative Lipid A core-O-antigen ligase and related protein [Magnetospira sp. QH-2]
MNFRSIHSEYLLGILLALTVPLALFASKGMAPLFVAIALVALGAHVLRRTPWPLPSSGILPAIAFFLWAAISLVWSIAPQEGIKYLPALAAMLVGGYLLVTLVASQPERERRTIEKFLMLGVAGGFVILAIEIWSPLAMTMFFRRLVTGEVVQIDYTAPNYYKAGACVAALMIWPALAAVLRRGHKSATVLLGFLGMVIIWASNSGAAMIGSLIGLGALFLFVTWPRWAPRLFAAAVVTVTVLMPVVPPLLPDPGQLEETYPNLPNGLYPRIFIWKSAIRFIDEAPILGLGLNTSRTLSSDNDAVFFTVPGGPGNTRQSEPIPLHPHNAALQVRLELGIPGAMLIAGFAVAVIRVFSRGRAIIDQGFAAAAMISALSIWFLSFSAWSSWWQASIWLCATGLALAPSSLKSRDDRDPSDEEKHRNTK